MEAGNPQWAEKNTETDPEEKNLIAMQLAVNLITAFLDLNKYHLINSFSNETKTTNQSP